MTKPVSDLRQSWYWSYIFGLGLGVGLNILVLFPSLVSKDENKAAENFG